MSIPGKFFAITVSKNYTQELSVLLEHNSDFFDKWYIVTQEDDIETIKLVSDFNHQNVELVYYPLNSKLSKPEDSKSILANEDLDIIMCPWTSSEKKKEYESWGDPIFDKGGAIRTVQKYILPNEEPDGNDLVILLDSDIVLPKNFKQELKKCKFETNTMYGTLRRDFAFYSDFKSNKNAYPFKQMLGAGFIQISLYDATKLCKRTMDCYFVDDDYKRQFKNLSMINEITVSHLGLCGMNWSGKKEDSFVFDKTDEDLISVTKKNEIDVDCSLNTIKFKLRSKLFANQLQNTTWKNNFPHFLIPGFRYVEEQQLKNELSKHYAINFGMSPTTEPNYFYNQNYTSSSWKDDVRWYMKFFQRDGTVWGDFAPLSFGCGWKVVVQRMKEVLVDHIWKNFIPPVFLVMVKDPIQRAKQEYYHNMKHFPASYNWGCLAPGKTFEENIELELEIYNKTNEDVWFESTDVGNLLKGGCYFYFLNYFKKELKLDESRLKVVESGRLIDNPKSEFNDIFNFLGVESDGSQNFNIVNEDVNFKVKADVNNKLKKFYGKYNQKLFELIDMKLAWE